MSGVRVALLTVSDGCFHGQRTDESGRVLREWCDTRGWAVVDQTVVPDETSAIVPRLLTWADRSGVQVVLTTGGTGLAPRDVAPEATAAVVERPAAGIAEALRRAGAQQTRYAPLSRGLVGVRGGCLIVNLPGSPAGVRDGLEVLEGFVDHAGRLIGGDTEHRAGSGA